MVTGAVRPVGTAGDIGQQHKRCLGSVRVHVPSLVPQTNKQMSGNRDAGTGQHV